MLIKESSLHNVENILNKLISIDEFALPVGSIPVFHNERLDKYLIQLESFIDFSKEHNYSDGGYVISLVCRENNIEDEIDKIGFVIHEESLYDKEMLNSYKQIKETVFPIYISRISKNDTYYNKLQNALTIDSFQESFDSCENIQNYCYKPINKRFGNEKIQESNYSLIKKLCSINKLNNIIINENKYTKGEQNLINTKKAGMMKKAAECIRSKIV